MHFEEICTSIGNRLGRSSGVLSADAATTDPGEIVIFGAPWMDILKMISEILIPLLANCSKANSTRSMMDRLKKPGLFERAALKIAIRQHVREEDGKLFGLRSKVNEIADAFTEEAETRDEDEISEVVAECCSV